MDMDNTLLFIAQNDESMMIKRKLHPGLKQLHYVANFGSLQAPT